MSEEERLNVQRRAAGEAARLPDLLAGAQQLADVVTAGRHPKKRPGRSDSFWQFRDYTPGDPVSVIDWRQSARLDRRLLVRQTEWEQPQTMLVWCGGTEDFEYGGLGREPKSFRGQIIALALAMVALRGGERAGVLGTPEPPRTGRHTADLIAEQLVSGHTPLEKLAPRTAALYLLVSDFHADPREIEAALARIRDTRGRAIGILIEDPDEAAFPFSGSTRIEGPRGSLIKSFGAADAIREDYLSARADHHTALREAFGGTGQTLIFHRTDHSAAPLLLNLVEQMGGTR